MFVDGTGVVNNFIESVDVFSHVAPGCFRQFALAIQKRFEIGVVCTKLFERVGQQVIINTTSTI